MKIPFHLSHLGQSPTLFIQQVCRRLVSEGHDLINLGLGQSPFPVPASVQSMLEKEAYRKDYLATEGLQELRELIVEFHNLRESAVYDAGLAILGPGSKELI